MNNRQLLIVGGLVVVSVALALALTRMFSAPPEQPTVHSTDPQPLPTVHQAAEGEIVAPHQSPPPPRPAAVSQTDEIRQTDENGVLWAVKSATGYLSAVASDGPRKPPVFVVKTEIRRPRSGEILIGFILEDRDGRRYQPGVMKAGSRMPAPRLQILTDAGEVILDDSFAYG